MSGSDLASMAARYMAGVLAGTFFLSNPPNSMLSAPRNQIQAQAFPGRFGPEMRLLLFDFAIFPIQEAICPICK
eukprot:141486-Rhodomonas_salina.1